MRLTPEGKKRAFLKSFNTTDMIYVPVNKMIDIKKTSETNPGLSQSSPISVPLIDCFGSNVKY